MVERLDGAGAVILGKLNMDEFAMGSSNENSAFKPCRNPWDAGAHAGRFVGRAARRRSRRGWCFGALGTDTGRLDPAAGRAAAASSALKPTYGRVSRYGVIAFASSLDQVGPFGRTVEDAAALLEVIAGHDERDATCIPAPAGVRLPRAGRGGRALRGLRVGVPDEYFAAGMDARSRRRCARRIEELATRGRAHRRGLAAAHASTRSRPTTSSRTAEASSNLARYDGVRYGLRAAGRARRSRRCTRETRGEGFGAEPKRRIMLGTYVLRAGYYDAYYLQGAEGAHADRRRLRPRRSSAAT